MSPGVGRVVKCIRVRGIGRREEVEIFEGDETSEELKSFNTMKEMRKRIDSFSCEDGRWMKLAQTLTNGGLWY
jgi:hypothetical protein